MMEKYENKRGKKHTGQKMAQHKDKVYLPGNWAKHSEVLYNIIANITSVAKLCIDEDDDDEIFSVGDKT